MNIQSLPIISEVYGEKGSGRNAFCLCICKDVPSLWIEAFRRTCTKRANSISIDLESMYICRAKSIHAVIERLRTGEIQNFIKDHKIKLVVVNRIEDLENPAVKKTKNYEELVRHLKRFYLTEKVKSIVVSGLSSTYYASRLVYRREVEDQKENQEIDLNRYITIQKYLGKAVPPSSIQGVSWEYSIPTKIYIERTPNPAFRLVRIVKPELDNSPRYVMHIEENSISIKSI